MKKNVASQVIGAQLVSASNGAAFTGAVTVSVTGDAGTQATGSVGSGACTHEGNGYHTYAPAQAETNYDLVAFTFTGSGAVPVTIQVYTTFPQTGDSFARIGATGSGLTTLASQTSVDDLPTNAELATAFAAADDAVLAAIAALNNLSQANIRTAVGLASANLDTQLDALPTNAELATALAAADDAVLAAIAALNNLSAAQVNAEMVDVVNVDTIAELAGVPSATPTMRVALMLLYMAVRNKRDTTATDDEIHNSAGTVVATAAVSDDGVTFTKAKYA